MVSCLCPPLLLVILSVLKGGAANHEQRCFFLSRIPLLWLLNQSVLRSELLALRTTGAAATMLTGLERVPCAPFPLLPQASCFGGPAV